jgi:hypothetical protein
MDKTSRKNLVLQAKAIAFAKKEYFGLMSKFYVVDSKILYKTQILEGATKLHLILQSYFVNDNDSKVIVSILEPIAHHLTQSTEPELITISPCPMCDQFFHYKDISIIYYNYTYHLWCLGFLLQTF